MKRLLRIYAVALVLAVTASSVFAQKFTCRAVDLFDAEGKMPVRGQMQFKSQSWYKWKLDGFKAGDVRVEVEYLCEGKGGSKIEVRFGSELLFAKISNTGRHDNGSPKHRTVTVGSLKFKDGVNELQVRANKDIGDWNFKLTKIRLFGEAVESATIQSYSLKEPERTPVKIKDLGIKHNKLSFWERLGGWELLFNGKDMTGWAGYRRDEITPAWKVVDGTMYLDKDKKEHGGDIISVNSYKDFELTMEWNISKGGNSGIMIRSRENKRAAWNTAIEMQVLDPEKSHNPLTDAGAAYDLFGPEKSPAKPAGEWNKARVKVVGMHYQMWLNDILTADFTVGSKKWTERIKEAKWQEYPGFGINGKGQIALQDHGDAVRYRNIKIRSLDNKGGCSCAKN